MTFFHQVVENPISIQIRVMYNSLRRMRDLQNYMDMTEAMEHTNRAVKLLEKSWDEATILNHYFHLYVREELGEEGGYDSWNMDLD